MIASIVPKLGTDFTLRVGFPTVPTTKSIACFCWLNSFILRLYVQDKCSEARTFPIVNKSNYPVPVPATFISGVYPSWSAPIVLADWFTVRVLELSFTAWDLAPFARDCGYDGPPFRWDDARRFLLRSELDAAFFHIYGIDRDDAAYILDAFPVVRNNDEAAHGEYRTKRVILEIYDRMSEAVSTEVPYQTLLNPPAADVRLTHVISEQAQPIGIDPFGTASAFSETHLGSCSSDRHERRCDCCQALILNACPHILEARGMVSAIVSKASPTFPLATLLYLLSPGQQL